MQNESIKDEFMEVIVADWKFALEARLKKAGIILEEFSFSEDNCRIVFNKNEERVVVELEKDCGSSLEFVKTAIIEGLLRLLVTFSK